MLTITQTYSLAIHNKSTHYSSSSLFITARPQFFINYPALTLFEAFLCTPNAFVDFSKKISPTTHLTVRLRSYRKQRPTTIYSRNLSLKKTRRKRHTQRWQMTIVNWQLTDAWVHAHKGEWWERQLTFCRRHTGNDTRGVHVYWQR